MCNQEKASGCGIFLHGVEMVSAQVGLKAQDVANPGDASPVPRLVKFGGVVRDADGKPLSGTVGMTFALYSEQGGGAARNSLYAFVI